MEREKIINQLVELCGFDRAVLEEMEDEKLQEIANRWLKAAEKFQKVMRIIGND